MTGWYVDLAKPSWNPPSWIFGPVWTVLYFAMAIAAWCVVRQTGRSGVRWAMTVIAFFRVSRPAGWLMFPYLAWVSFAGILNLTIWQLNA